MERSRGRDIGDAPALYQLPQRFPLYQGVPQPAGAETIRCGDRRSTSAGAAALCGLRTGKGHHYLLRRAAGKLRILIDTPYFKNILNHFIFPLNGGYFIDGSIKVGVRIIAFAWVKVS